MHKEFTICIITSLLIVSCIKPAIANSQEYIVTDNIQISNDVYPVINSGFNDYQRQVDINIFNSMKSVNKDTLINLYGDNDTLMFNKAKECINPCIAFATTWGEAGSAAPGISLTTVMDFTDSNYDGIDWVKLSKNLEQVDSAWYISNCINNYNVNESGNVYHMPVALLQYPSSGSRSTSAMTGLGVGSYQITSSDWDKWDLDERVNPVVGYEMSFAKAGDTWFKCDINPTSDLTVYAALSLAHQGGALPGFEFGKRLLNKINEPQVQRAFNQAGYDMYIDMLEKSYSKDVTLSDVSVTKYLRQVEATCGVTFSSYNGGEGRTNKGNYVALHLLRYVFYKNYFSNGGQW